MRNHGLPVTDVWSVAFDPAHSGRIYASAHEEALYVSDDAGKSWTKDGLDGSILSYLFKPIEKAFGTALTER